MQINPIINPTINTATATDVIFSESPNRLTIPLSKSAVEITNIAFPKDFPYADLSVTLFDDNHESNWFFPDILQHQSQQKVPLSKT